MDALLLLAAVVSGGFLAVQASVNLQLTKAVGTPYGASTLQLGVAAGLLLVLAVTSGALGPLVDLWSVPAWQLLGGLASPLYITSGILLFPRLGALATVGLFVTGQMFASLGLDLFGLLGVPVRPLSAGILLGTAATLTGITAIIRGQRTAVPAAVPAAGPADEPGPAAAGTAVATRPFTVTGTRTRQSGWVVLGVVAGAGLPIQGAVNARLKESLAAPLAVALVSFTVAVLAIAVVLAFLVRLKATTVPVFSPLSRMPWWGWLGAACAVAYVIATFTLIPLLGAATTVALTVTGQQVASAAIDGRGLFRLPQRPLTLRRWLGLGLLVIGSAMIQLA